MSNSVCEILKNPDHRLATIRWNASISDALLRLAALGVADMVVMSMGTPIGTVTEQELLRSQCMSLNAETQHVSEVMTLRMVRISTCTTIEEAMAISIREQSRQLVVMEADRFVGVITSADLATWLVRNQAPLVRDFMAFVVEGAAGVSGAQRPVQERPKSWSRWLAPVARSKTLRQIQR